jgi:ABC-type transport system substrate-binding protein
MGVSSPNQFQDLQLGKVDLTELSPDQVRRASQAGLRTWSSAPVELFAIVFDKEASADSRIRQALSLSVDRAAITNVLLQKLGEPAGGVLPQWLSGYAFLFSTSADMQSAQQLCRTTRDTGAEAGKPLRLGVGDEDDTARLIAERVALNARQAGLAVQVTARGEADARLIRWRLDSIAAPAVLFDVTRALDMSDESAAALKKISSNDPEQTYAAERAIIGSYRVIPLVYLPETIALGPAVRNWMPRRWAEWHLEDVWLDLQMPAPVSGAGTAGARP